jgi:hypothetical protein
MSSEKIVLGVFPQATGHRFQFGGCKIYQHPDIEAPGCYLLGSGFDLKVTPEQDEVDYKNTMEAAWDHAAYFVTWAKEWLAYVKPGGHYHTGTYAGQKFETFRQLFRRYYKVNHTRVCKQEFLQKLALALKWREEDEGELPTAATCGASITLGLCQPYVCELQMGHSGMHCSTEPGSRTSWKDAPAPNPPPVTCNKYAAPFIAGGPYFSCVLPTNHEGEHRAGGTCVKHGPYVMERFEESPQCPMCQLTEV